MRTALTTRDAAWTHLPTAPQAPSAWLSGCGEGRGRAGGLWRHDLGMAEDPSLAELTAELAELRAENARLRGLLGFDRRAENVAVAGWSPSLFRDQPARSDGGGRAGGCWVVFPAGESGVVRLVVRWAR